MESKLHLGKAFQLKAKDVAFDALFDLLPINFSWMDPQGYILGCNQRVLNSLHFLSFNDVIGKHTAEVASEQAWENTRIVLKTGKPFLAEEVHQDKDGKKTYFLSLKSPMKARQGKILGIVNIAIDVTDRKLMEMELAKSKEAAQLADRAKIEFLMNMRHDIRTPLTGIIGFAELIKDQSGDPHIREYATHLLDSSRELLYFLNEILEVINLTSGHLPLLHKKFDLKAILVRLGELNKTKVKQKQLQFIFDYDQKIPPYLIGDSQRIQKIVLELLSNALKFTHQGQVHLSATLAEEKEQLAIVKIMVQDTGVGISPQKKDMVFARFNRLHPSYEGVYQGIGAGLTIVKQLVDDFGGEIHLESEPEKGSTFMCVLPLKKPLLNDDFGVDSSVAPSHRSTTISQSTSIQLENNPRILLVEDSVPAMLATQNILENVGCSISVAKDGKTALALFNTHEYDLILMDIGLPDMSGHEVTKAIRVKETLTGKHTPILALTAHGEAKKKQACMASGMDAVYVKPLYKGTAIDILGAFISKKSAIAQDSPLITP